MHGRILGIPAPEPTATALTAGCAIALAHEGARVTICARSETDLAAAAADIRHATGAEVIAVPAEISRAPDIHPVAEATLERSGEIDILVNNSGGPPLGSCRLAVAKARAGRRAHVSRCETGDRRALVRASVPDARRRQVREQLCARLKPQRPR